MVPLQRHTLHSTHTLLPRSPTPKCTTLCNEMLMRCIFGSPLHVPLPLNIVLRSAPHRTATFIHIASTPKQLIQCAPATRTRTSLVWLLKGSAPRITVSSILLNQRYLPEERATHAELYTIPGKYHTLDHSCPTDILEAYQTKSKVAFKAGRIKASIFPFRMGEQ